MPGTKFSIETRPRLPAALHRLEELANNLFYSWHGPTVDLFETLDDALWDNCQHNPKLFLHRVAQVKLDEAAQDKTYLAAYTKVLERFDAYLKHSATCLPSTIGPLPGLVAYFCAEFGFHESLPIYSGGLGILAGDHCKAASDLGVSFVAVGLLYRQGYFTQTLDSHGNQIAHFTPTDFDTLPIKTVTDGNGEPLLVHVPVKQDLVALKIWQANIGRVTLYLLDTDIEQNSVEHRSITYQLYGGDSNTRIQQELILSLGGVRALRALNLQPDVWHINEGHAGFLVLERCRELMQQYACSFDSALEACAASIVFTTHTPVPAGHDIFSADQIKQYLHTLLGELNIDTAELLRLGQNQNDHGSLNMTSLALRGSRFRNGVSKIHGQTAAEMEQGVWPQISADENPIESITNGIHVPTFLAREWTRLFDSEFRDWQDNLIKHSYWEQLDRITPDRFWQIRAALGKALTRVVIKRLHRQLERNRFSQPQINRITQQLRKSTKNTLILGFARRFATYKRATLLFSDPERLARILSQENRRVIILFAGKAHPNDMPGQHLIKVIHDFSQQPEFEGKILLLENYDLALARRMIAGVDVWLNTPEYPLEASGTSGEKAGANGVLNLSVLDGWWHEGFDESHGWGITPHGPQYDNAYRNQQEANELLDILEHEVIPCYFERDSQGLPLQWIQRCKNSMKQIIPRFNASRMVLDYLTRFYIPAAREGRRRTDRQCARATELAEWKHHVEKMWPGVRIHYPAPVPYSIGQDEQVTLRVEVFVNGLNANDLVVECLFGLDNEQGQFAVKHTEMLAPLADTGESGESDSQIYQAQMIPPMSGLQYFKFRVYPCHASLVHPLETGKMLWV